MRIMNKTVVWGTEGKLYGLDLFDSCSILSGFIFAYMSF